MQGRKEQQKEENSQPAERGHTLGTIPQLVLGSSLGFERLVSYSRGRTVRMRGDRCGHHAVAACFKSKRERRQIGRVDR